MVENIKKVSERVTVTEPKRSACWDLHESSGRCLVYKQNDWLEWHSRNESRPKSMRRDKPLHGKFLSIAEGQPQETDRNFQWLVSGELKITSRGVASFSTCCSPGWLHFHTSVKIAHMTNMHWPHQNFELLSFLAHPNNEQINYWALIVTAQEKALGMRTIQAKLYHSAETPKCR